MKGGAPVSQIHFEQDLGPRASRFRTGVSLHGHTLHSEEKLDFIYRVARQITPIRIALERSEARHRRLHGVSLDLSRAWWTPPLSAYEAWAVETRQITERLGLAPLVSLSDHDNIDGPILLQHRAEMPADASFRRNGGRSFGGTRFFHIGIHSLRDRESARELNGRSGRLHGPDIEGRSRRHVPRARGEPRNTHHFQSPQLGRKQDRRGGPPRHRPPVCRHLPSVSPRVRAEWPAGAHGRRTAPSIDLARHFGELVISGGDRHGLEPNALLNLSNASSFPEFVEEIRDGYSHVVLTKQYMEPLSMRVLQQVEDVLRDYDRHVYGTHWSDRSFYLGDDGVTRPLSALWGEEPLAVRLFTRGVNFLGNPQFKHAFPPGVRQTGRGRAVRATRPRIPYKTGRQIWTTTTRWWRKRTESRPPRSLARPSRARSYAQSTPRTSYGWSPRRRWRD